ncbi:MAG: ribulose-phosphate 3-epimerase [Acetobacter sp.]|nr:ribulose-phosphate 3-epimerase [Acetobacter sp.]
MVKIAPSILAANSADFGSEVIRLEKDGADLIHFDVMDGHFVPNITFGPKILKDMKKYTSLPFDVHLMVNNPARFVPWYAEAGANIITFHLEATEEPLKIIELIHRFGIKAGISIKPHTNVCDILSIRDNIDLILVMSVEPGFGGQSFIDTTPQKIMQVKQLIEQRSILIEVDGGITPATAKLCSDADILVAGTAVFAKNTYRENICALKGEKI